MTEIISLVYLLIVFGIIGVFLHLGFRFVRAIEKISDIYERKNS